MKKSLFSTLALTALLFGAASCSNQDVAAPEADGPVTFSIALPGEFTRADISDGTKAVKLNYAVYLKGEDNILFTSQEATDPQPANFSGLKTTLSLDLAKGKTYDIIFWADVPNNPYYTFTPATKSVTMDYSAPDGNDENRDAFFQHVELEVKGASTQNVTLRRPFAQLNFATSDYAEAKKAGLKYGGSKVVVKNVHNTLNLLDGKASGAAEVTFDYAALVENETTTHPGTTDATKLYTWLSMNYLLTGSVVPDAADVQKADKELVDVAFEVYAPGATDDVAGDLINTVNVSQVPVQRNYRTNIYGNLLTSAVDFNIVIDPIYYEPAWDVEYGAAQMKQNADGSVTCVTPALPAGVTPEDLTNKGGVIVKSDGTTQIFDTTTGSEINNLMAQAKELYFAPNVTITTGSHHMNVPASGITIHGNGATITGGEQDFSINADYPANSTVNVVIENLNGVKVWGQPKNNVTFNIILKGCSMLGESYLSGENLVMARGADSDEATVNLNISKCYVENVQVAIHTTMHGTISMSNCKFKNVGIPINIAKKLPTTSDITIRDCEFDGCGIDPASTNSATTYSAPIRVVDNSTAANSITLAVDKCTFKDTKSAMDILLMDYREGKQWTAVNCTITNCIPAEPTVKAE
jgi:hypothetical protein